MSLPAPDPSTTVLVTGASAGIGEALVHVLAERGHGLTLVARRQQVLDGLAERLRADHGVTVEAFAADLRDDARRDELVDHVRSGPRHLVGLCNAAGMGSVGPVATADPRREADIVRLNVLALHDLTVRLVRDMVARREGAILNFGSINGYQPLPNTATYSATKAFVIHFSEALHAELAGTGVSCTQISPGATRTEIFRRAGAGDVYETVPDFLWQDPIEVARAGVEAMEEGRRTVVPGVHNKLSSVGGRIAPRTLLLPAIRRLTSRYS